MKRSEVNGSKRVLEVVSCFNEPMKSNSIYYQIEGLTLPAFRYIMRSLWELGLIKETKFSHYEITDMGQYVLNEVRGSKA
jgi:predicted transcriptional regulator